MTLQPVEKLRAGASAWATDGPIGTVIALVVDPGTTTVSHVIVRTAGVVGSGRIVPLHHVTQTGADHVDIDLSRAQVLACDPFLIPGHLPAAPASGGVAAYWIGPAGGDTFVVHEQLPHDGDVALRAHALVRDKSGHRVGALDDLVIEPGTGTITHVMVRRRHLIDRGDVLVPVSALSGIGGGEVRLTLDRDDLRGLPVVTTHN